MFSALQPEVITLLFPITEPQQQPPPPPHYNLMNASQCQFIKTSGSTDDWFQGAIEVLQAGRQVFKSLKHKSVNPDADGL